VRYAYAITSALLLGGATATLALQPSVAQQALSLDAWPAPKLASGATAGGHY